MLLEHNVSSHSSRCAESRPIYSKRLDIYRVEVVKELPSSNECIHHNKADALEAVQATNNYSKSVYRTVRMATGA